MTVRAPFLAEKCVELLQAAMPQLAVIQHNDPWHGVHARGKIDAATTVKFVYLFPTSGARLDLHLYPADTLSQARALYADPARVDRLLALRNDGWTLTPNFHFGFMTKGLTWTHTNLDTDAYIAYWVERIASLGIYRRDDWLCEIERLRKDGILDADDAEHFERDFTNTDRNHATPRPGLRLARQWDISHAMQPGFPEDLRTKLRSALSALGEHHALANVT